MSLIVKERNENLYLYFQQTDGKHVFVGKIGETTNYSDRVFEAYGEISKKYSKYLNDSIKLISILPESERKKYSSKLINELKNQIDNVSSLSPSMIQKYKTKESKTEERETRRRQLKDMEVFPTRGIRNAKNFPEVIIEFLKRPIMADEILRVQENMNIKNPKDARKWSMLDGIGQEPFNEFLDLIWTWFTKRYHKNQSLNFKITDLYQISTTDERIPMNVMLIKTFSDILVEGGYLRPEITSKKRFYSFTEKGINTFVKALKEYNIKLDSKKNKFKKLQKTKEIRKK